MKYSVFTVSLPTMKPEQIVKELKRIGYDGVEWRVHDAYHFKPENLEKDAPYIKKITKDAGLVISSVSTYITPTNQELGKRLINATAAMGASAIRFFTGGYDPKAGYRNQYNEVRKGLENFLPLLKSLKIKILVEIHHETITSSASTAYALLKDLPQENFGILYDPANMIVEGRERMGFEIAGHYLSYVHAKDVMFVNENNKWDYRWMSPGEGLVDWKAIFAGLKSSKYNGFVSSENLYLVSFKDKLGPVEYEKFLIDSITKELAFLKKYEKEVMGK